jgi:hypothetical protein
VNENLEKHSEETDLTQEGALRTDTTNLSSRVGKLETVVQQLQQYLNIENVEPGNSAQEKSGSTSEAGSQTQISEKSDDQYMYDSSLIQNNSKRYHHA